MPPISCIRPCMKDVHYCLGGVPPSPLFLSCILCARLARCSSGGFPSSYSPWFCAGMARYPAGLSPSPPRACMVRALQFRGVPSSSSSWLCDGVARGLAGVAPSLPCPRAVCARCWVGGSPLLLPLVAVQLGRALPCRGVPLRTLDLRRRHALTGEGSLPSFTPWVVAHIKCAQLLGGGVSLLVSVVLHDMR